MKIEEVKDSDRWNDEADDVDLIVGDITPKESVIEKPKGKKPREARKPVDDAPLMRNSGKPREAPESPEH